MLLANNVFSTLAENDQVLALCQNPVFSKILGGVYQKVKLGAKIQLYFIVLHK